METEQIKRIVEGLLLASQKPIALERFVELFQQHTIAETTPGTGDIEQALGQLAEDCQGRSYELKRVASGYRLQIRAELAPWLGRLWEEKPQRYTRALLETLALVAYRQPITRGEIEDIRGVAVSSNIIRTLQDREWIRVVGHRDVPGRPAMFATTRLFLDYFNLENLDQLPTLSEIRSLEQVAQQFGIEDLPPEITAAGEEDALPDEEATAQLFAELDEIEADLPDSFDDLITMKQNSEDQTKTEEEGEEQEQQESGSEGVVSNLVP